MDGMKKRNFFKAPACCRKKYSRALWFAAFRAHAQGAAICV